MAGQRGQEFEDDVSVPPPRLRTTRGRGRSRKPPGKATFVFATLIMLLILGLGIVGFVRSVADLPYRTGSAGVAGTVSLITCAEDRSGRSPVLDCVGTFTATDGSVTRPVADIEGHSDLAGRELPARLHPDGTTVSVVATATVLFSLAGVFGSLILVILIGGIGSLILVGGLRRRRGRSPLSKRPAHIVLIVAGVIAVTALALLIVGSASGV